MGLHFLRTAIVNSNDTPNSQTPVSPINTDAGYVPKKSLDPYKCRYKTVISELGIYIIFK
jgi:hypothetical protein